MSIFGGPYTLTKEPQGSQSVRSVKTLCIMDNFDVSTRTYENGTIKHQTCTHQSSLSDAISKAISELERLMQYEKYNPNEKIDMDALRALIRKTSVPAPALPPVLPIAAPVVNVVAPINNVRAVPKIRKS